MLASEVGYRFSPETRAMQRSWRENAGLLGTRVLSV